VSKAIPSGPAVERTRNQIAEYQRFRQLTRDLLVTNQQICDARLEEAAHSSPSDNKKNRAGRGVGGRAGARDGGSTGHRRG